MLLAQAEPSTSVRARRKSDFKGRPVPAAVPGLRGLRRAPVGGLPTPFGDGGGPAVGRRAGLPTHPAQEQESLLLPSDRVVWWMLCTMVSDHIPPSA